MSGPWQQRKCVTEVKALYRKRKFTSDPHHLVDEFSVFFFHPSAFPSVGRKTFLMSSNV